MLASESMTWSDRLRGVLERYDEPLLRQVVQALLRPRNQWPAEELIARSVDSVENAATVDRRLQDLEPASRHVLTLIGRSRQPRWQVGNLVEMLVALGQAADVRPILALLQAGLLYPELPEGTARLRSFEQWIGTAGPTGLEVFAHPEVTARALAHDLDLPECPGQVKNVSAIPEADGLEWPLRLAVIWQQVAAAPLRRTQQGDFFKRDLERLRTDPLLNVPLGEGPVVLSDLGLLAVELALVQGRIRVHDGDITAGDVPSTPERGVESTLEMLLASLPRLRGWNVHDGWRGPSATANPYPSAYLLVLLLLGRLDPDHWADVGAIDTWLAAHHPYWAGHHERAEDRQAPALSLASGFATLAYSMRLVQLGRGAEGSLVTRLTAYGRRLLGLGERPADPPAFPKTLMVQPNLEIIVYRQGLTPALIGRLGQFAAWKNIGPACTLQLQPDTVYRALETGLTFETMLRTLEQHGMRPVPTAVIESLRTWANKRDRLSIYNSATLFEFQTADDLNEALARGLPGVRISERLALVASESGVDFRHFRLTATRDYGLSLEKCVDVEPDGVTLTVDVARSDLLLETELTRFAELLPSSANGRRQYRLTAPTLDAAQKGGVGIQTLEEWFLQRTGQPLTPAARLLLMGNLLPPLEMRRLVVLQVPGADIADGLVQWPGTRSLIASRLGPTALAIADENVDAFRQRLGNLGIGVKE